MISVVIPTYKKAPDELKNCLRNLIRQVGDYEIIVSDHGTKDLTGIIGDVIHPRDLHPKITAFQYDTSDGMISRSCAMNQAAEKASGDIVLFLHSDTVLPQNALLKIEQIIGAGAVAGGFLKHYDHKPWMLSVTEFLLNLRAKWKKEFVGTNAIFLERETFLQIKYNENFLEDVELSDELIKRFGKDKLGIINDFVTVSSLKYIRLGALKGIVVNALIMTMFRIFKIRHETLEEFYRGQGSTTYLQIAQTAIRMIFSNEHGAKCSLRKKPMNGPSGANSQRVPSRWTNGIGRKTISHI